MIDHKLESAMKYDTTSQRPFSVIIKVLTISKGYGMVT